VLYYSQMQTDTDKVAMAMRAATIGNQSGCCTSVSSPGAHRCVAHSCAILLIMKSGQKFIKMKLAADALRNKKK